VLDLGCGTGAVTSELVRRSAGPVVAVDRNLAALMVCRNTLSRLGASDSLPAAARLAIGKGGQAAHGTRAKPLSARPGVFPVQADAARLPLAPESFDLVFCQFTLMWVDAPAAIAEIHRVLAAGGQLIALEPDYEAMIEYPAQIATRRLWLTGLARAGAEPLMGRKLPGMLTAAGFSVRVDLLDRLMPPSAVRFELLRGLPLEPAERHALAEAEAADGRLAAAGQADDSDPRVAHLPVFLVTAIKQP